MGLDIYLERKHYVQNWDHMHDVDRHTVVVKKGGIVRQDIKPERISYIVEEVGYWRKFNALHNWFVETTQNGADECMASYVSRGQLKALLDVLVRIAADHSLAAELLPTQPGFFFGSTDYDEYYFWSVERTIPILEEAIVSQHGSYYYQASW